MTAAAATRTVQVVDADRREPSPRSSPADALTPRLPVMYADALALADAGFGAETIAQRLAVPTESVPALLEIARAKVCTIVDHDDAHGRGGDIEVP